MKLPKGELLENNNKNAGFKITETSTGGLKMTLHSFCKFAEGERVYQVRIEPGLVLLMDETHYKEYANEHI